MRYAGTSENSRLLGQPVGHLRDLEQALWTGDEAIVRALAR
jgi:hypothetical protein